MGLFRSSEVIGIARDTLDFVRGAAEDAHPDEYLGLLRGEDASRLGLDRSGQVVTDVLVVPGTETNPVSATHKPINVPNDRTAIGSVHSHPNGVLRPSDEDLTTFTKGKVHVILGAPYGVDDWRAFDRDGDPRKLEVLDVDLPDADDFFHFTQDDLDAEMDPEEFRGER